MYASTVLLTVSTYALRPMASIQLVQGFSSWRPWRGPQDAQTPESQVPGDADGLSDPQILVFLTNTPKIIPMIARKFEN